LSLEHPLVVAGHDLDERGNRRRPVEQQPLATRTARELHVTLDQSAYERDLLLVVEILEVDQGAIAPRAELIDGVEHVGDATAHAGREVAAGPADHDDATARHVFAAVVADTLDHRECAAVAYGEPLPRQPPHVGLAAGGTVERHVADDDVLLGDERRPLRWPHTQR